MRIKIWGARGSIPTPLTTPEYRERLREVLERSRGVNITDPGAVERFIDRLPAYLNTVVSGNTTCIEVRANDSLFILDMGSGIRALGRELMQEAFGSGAGEAHILISHTHWDHIEGFPFFIPAFRPGNKLHFHTPFEDMEDRLRHVMHAPTFFPVDLDYPQAARTFDLIRPGKTHEIGGAEVELMPLKHPGGAFAYKIRCGGKTMVYATDGEYPSADQADTAIYEAFYRDADVLIFDAMYTYEDTVNAKIDWGHSTAKIGAELAWRAGVKRLVLTHHDPEASAQKLWAKIDDADQHIRFRNNRDKSDQRFVQVFLAYEGLTLEL